MGGMKASRFLALTVSLASVACGTRLVVGDTVHDTKPPGTTQDGGATDSGPTDPTEAGSPCGVCPVFDVCSDAGIISPSSCVYIDAWGQW